MSKLPPKAKPDVTADIVIFTIADLTLKVLLVKRDEPPFPGKFALPGGFLWKDETTAEAAMRVLASKTGVKDVFFEQLFTFDNIKRDPRGHILSVAYFALVPAEKLDAGRLAAGALLADAQSARSLAFDHDEMLRYAVRRLRTKLAYSNIAYSLLPELFTLSQLQEVYEVILGHEVDKRNFRKKIMSLDIIEPTEQKLSGQRHRPARLYRFKKRGYEELEEPIF